MSDLDEMTLRRLYLDEGLSIGRIAKLLHVRKQSICAALAQWDIPRRSRGARPVAVVREVRLTEAYLRRRYVDEGATIRDIAAEAMVSSRAVRNALIHWNIPRRRRGPRRDRPPLPEPIRQAIRSRVAVLGITETARRIQQSAEVIHAIIGTEPLPRGQKPRVDDQAARDAYDTGTPIADIAARFSVSERAIRWRLQRTCVRAVDMSTIEPGTTDGSAGS